MPNTGPREGSRRATTAFLPIRRSPSASPTVVVVLPSPAGVGVIAVTRTSLPSGRFVSFRKRLSILALYLPYCSIYAPSITAGVRNIRDGKGLRLLGDLDIAFDGHGCLLFSGLSVSRHPAVSCSIIPAPPGKSNSSLQIPLFSNLLQVKHRRRLLHSGLCVHVLCYL